MLRTYISLIVTLSFSIILSGTSRAAGDEYYNRTYGWRVALPSGVKADESAAPDTITLKIGKSGRLTLESGLPSEFFLTPLDESNILVRLLGLAADKVEILSMGSGALQDDLGYQDIEYSVKTGSEELRGFLRFYQGHYSVLLAYKDKPDQYQVLIPDIRNFADTLYFPSLGQVLKEKEYTMEEFINPAVGYKVKYPSILTHDDVWSFLSFSFLGDSVVDILLEPSGPNPSADIFKLARDASLEDLSVYDYKITKDIRGATGGGIKYNDFIVDDNDANRWMKHVRIYDLGENTLRFDFYCSEADFDATDAVFSTMVNSFEYDPTLVTDTSYFSEDIPIEEAYILGDFSAEDYKDAVYGFTLSYPDFLTTEELENTVFFNYDYKTVITMVREYREGLDKNASLEVGAKAAKDEFGLNWKYTLRDASQGQINGWPYQDFFMDDNDAEGGWAKRVRVIGLSGFSVRFEMYLFPPLMEELSPLFEEFTGSFKYTPSLIGG